MKNPYFPNNNFSSFPGNYGKVTPFPATLPPVNPDGDKDEEFDIRRFLSVIQRRALIITIVTVGVTGTITYTALNQPSVYEGSFQLLIENKNSGSNLTGITGLAPGISDRVDGEVDFQTQISILRSPSILEPIIQDLTKKDGGINYISLIDSNKLQINKLDKTKIIEFRYRDPDPKRVESVLKTLAAGYMNYSVQSKQQQIVKSISFVEQQLDQVTQRVNTLQGTVQNFRQSYNLYSPEASAAQVYGQMEQVQQEKQKTRMELNILKARSTNLKKQLGLSINQSLTLLSLQEAPQYQSLVKSYSEIDQKIAIESSRFNANTPVIKLLKDQQQSLLPLLNQETQQILGVNFSKKLLTKPSVNPTSVLGNLTQQVIQTNLEIPTLETKYYNLNQIQTDMIPKIKQQPLIARKYVDLQRELTVANESLNRFLTVGENLGIEKAKQQLPWQLITPPKGFDIPITPDVPRNIFTGLIIGLGLGIGVGFLMEKLNNVFHSPDELKDFTKLPVLGNIPYTKNIVFATPQVMINGDNLVIVNSHNSDGTEKEDNSDFFGSSSPYATGRKNQNNDSQIAGSPFVESFRNIYTNIQFLNDKPTNSMVISSTLPGDGKSTISAHLAQAAASMGQRVLLIDADLRRPKVHHNLQLSNNIGLSNMIAMDINIKQALQQLPGWDDLYILTAGQEPPDPTRLLSSKKMQSLMEEFHALFDLVIYDTPPLLGLADARLLAPYTDGILMVVSMGKTDRGLLNQALSNVQTSRANVLGVVANGVRRTAFDSNNYYSHYYRN